MSTTRTLTDAKEAALAIETRKLGLCYGLTRAEQDERMATHYRHEPIYTDIRAALALAASTADRINDAVDAVFEALTAVERAQVAALLGNTKVREHLGQLPEYIYRFVSDAASEHLGNIAEELLTGGIRPD
jgi:hypothetical protein